MPSIDEKGSYSGTAPGTRESESRMYGKMNDMGGMIPDMSKLNNLRHHREIKGTGFNIITGTNPNIIGSRPF